MDNVLGKTSRKLTLQDKYKMYKEGAYMFQPPPVCTTYWGMDDWVKYIDAHGKWT